MKNGLLELAGTAHLTGEEQFELLFDESKFRLEPQPVELVNEVDPQDTTLVYRLDRNGVGRKSKIMI